MQDGNKTICKYFNPRPREEGDDAAIYTSRLSPISIHALVKRATVALSGSGVLCLISIHALVKRATLRKDSATLAVLFQSTPS